MMEAHAIPATIQWHEGMLLAPQHFQQLVLRQEALMHYHLQAIAPFCWGVQQFKFDRDRLISGTFAVLELEAVMPDGLVVSYEPGREKEQLRFDLKTHQAQMASQETTIHLAVPAATPGAIPTQGGLKRYDSVEGALVVDVNTGEDGLSIPRLRPCLSLKVGETLSPRHVSFPLLRLRYEQGKFVQTDFIPPCLTVSKDSPLWDECAALATRLRDKAHVLAERTRAPSVAMGAPLTLGSTMQIQRLVAALPHFEAVLHTEGVHPYTLYLALCSLVGQVATAGTMMVPPVFAPYNHNDLRTTFTQARDFIDQVLCEGFPEAYTPYPLQFDDGFFHLLFERSWIDRRLVLGARAKPGMTEADVKAWVAACVIGSKTRMPAMREKRILGAERHQIDGDADLVPERGVVLFDVKGNPTFIEPNEVLQIFHYEQSRERRPIEMVLYVKNLP
jgi:type VI secretion system protein ImpJ